MARDDLITELLADLYNRARPQPTSPNKTLTKYMLASDRVTADDEVTLTVRTPPFRTAPSANNLVVGQGQVR